MAQLSSCVHRSVLMALLALSAPGGCEYEIDAKTLPVTDTTLSPGYLEPLLWIDETKRLVQFFGDDIWPGFHFPEPVSYYFSFPGGMGLGVGDIIKDTHRYKRLRQYNYNGEYCYLKGRPNPQIPSTVRFSILSGKAYNFGNQYLFEGKATVVPSFDEFVNEGWPDNPHIYERENALDTTIQLMVHETFHLYQESVWSKRPVLFPGRYYDVADAIPFNDRAGRYNRYEWIAMVMALLTENELERRAHIVNYLIARNEKKKQLEPGYIRAERFMAMVEGTAVYVEIRLLNLLVQSGYRTDETFNDNPLFANYRLSEELLRVNMANHAHQLLTFAQTPTQYQTEIYYLLGAFQTLLLDAIAPNWKETFDWSENFDELLSRYTGFSDTGLSDNDVNNDMKNVDAHLNRAYPANIEDSVRQAINNKWQLPQKEMQ